MEITPSLFFAFLAGCAAVVLWHHYKLGDLVSNTLRNLASPPQPQKPQPNSPSKPLSYLLTTANWVSQANAGTISVSEQEQKAALFLKMRLDEMFEEKPKRAYTTKPKKSEASNG